MASDVDVVRGCVILASGVSSAAAIRRAKPNVRRILFDPQLYLAGLDASDCQNTCRRLASFDWFGVDVPEYESTEQSMRDWEREVANSIATSWPQAPADTDDGIYEACLSAIEFQEQLGSTHIILPSPLLQEREQETTVLTAWLDKGIDAANEIDPAQPLLASIALDERILNDAIFEDAALLDTIVDQVTVRDAIDGVYIVIAQSEELHPFEMNRICRKAYLHLCKAFSETGIGLVLTNFSDLVGHTCSGVGAHGFATGVSLGSRRLCLAAYRDRDGGAGAIPRYYSHRACSEYWPETDLDRFDQRMVRRIRDSTPFSDGLLEALVRGGSASGLPQWAESRGNVTTGHRHFIHRLAVEGRRVMRTSASDRPDTMREWLEDAAVISGYIHSRTDGVRGDVVPVEAWLQDFEDYVG